MGNLFLFLLSCQNNKGRRIPTADRHIKLFLKHVLVEKGIKDEDLASRRNKLRRTYKYMTPDVDEYGIACRYLLGVGKASSQAVANIPAHGTL